MNELYLNRKFKIIENGDDVEFWLVNDPDASSHKRLFWKIKESNLSFNAPCENKYAISCFSRGLWQWTEEIPPKLYNCKKCIIQNDQILDRIDSDDDYCSDYCSDYLNDR